MTSFKLYFENNNDIRRLSFPMDRPSYEQFTEKLCSLYPATFHPELTVKYVDSDGDKISVTTEIEWDEMWEELSEERVKKLYITEGLNHNAYFKDGPEPEPLYFYNDSTSKEPLPMDKSDAIPYWKCLERFFPMGKILPNNIPSFLKDSVKINYLPGNQVDLDIDINQLCSDLHRQAMDCLDSTNVEVLRRGKECLLARLQLVPNHAVTLYNLACAESLLNNVPDALYSLMKSLKNGYRDLEHMLQDADLDNIKNTEEFQKIVTALSTGDFSILFGEESPFDSFEENVEKAFTEPEQPEPELPEPELPEPQPEDERYKKYEDQINTLREMGFQEDQLNYLLLEEYENFDEVVSGLVELYRSTNRPVPIVEPEPEPEPEPLPDPRLEEFAASIEVISKMGFEIDSSVLDILEQTKGDVGRAIVSILEQ
jgi:hypothetical protein